MSGKWVPPSLRRRREEERKRKELGRTAPERTVRSPDAQRVRFAIDDKIHVVNKLTPTQIRGSYRDPEGEDGPDYCYIGQQRKTRLCAFRLNVLCKKTFLTWREYTHTKRAATDSNAMDKFGSPTTSTGPIPIRSVSSQSVGKQIPIIKAGSNPETCERRDQATDTTPRPHSFPRVGLELMPRAGMKRDSPGGTMASPSKRACVMLDKLKLGSPLFGRSSSCGPPSSGPRFRERSVHSEANGTGSIHHRFKPLVLPPTPPSSSASLRPDTKNNVRSFTIPERRRTEQKHQQPEQQKKVTQRIFSSSGDGTEPNMISQQQQQQQPPEPWLSHQGART
mmetsp:Transcript_26946/g.65442  ORF Transcript_26946/g.65442 Transcript_26946/m.65442 type:complete len:336 (-) Transcript_26946:551-1558(-)